MKIPAVESELFTHGQTDIRKLSALFRNFANEPKNCIFQETKYNTFMCNFPPPHLPLPNS